MASSTTPIPPIRAEWTASGACTSGSTAHPRGATRRASGGAATTSTTRAERHLAAHPACSVLRPPAGRKSLDQEPLSADPGPHRATWVASDVIERTAQAKSKLDAGWSVSAEGVRGRKPSEDVGSARLAPRERALSPVANGQQHGCLGCHGAPRQHETRETMDPYRKSQTNGFVVPAGGGKHLDMTTPGRFAA